jgi:hypothetical protein
MSDPKNIRTSFGKVDYSWLCSLTAEPGHILSMWRSLL